jgi:hypothetical protein
MNAMQQANGEAVWLVIEWVDGKIITVHPGERRTEHAGRFIIEGEGPDNHISLVTGPAFTRTTIKLQFALGEREPNVYLADQNNRVPLYIAYEHIANGHPNALDANTEYIGANFMPLNNRPSNKNLALNYVYLHSELKNGRAPRAYHANGISRWAESGRTNNPITREPLFLDNMRVCVPRWGRHSHQAARPNTPG